MHAVEELPPGPAAPAAAQTVEWIARPTDLLRRSAARYGEPFTLRTLWADAPMVLVSDPETIRRVYAAPGDVLRGGASSTVLEPFAGSSSILVTSGEAHLRRRRQMLPPFHGARMEAHRAEIAALAEAELARWRPGTPLQTLPRMQSLTLDIILRVVLGGSDPPLRAAIRETLDMTTSMARLIALSLAPRGTASVAAVHRGHRPGRRAPARRDRRAPGRAGRGGARRADRDRRGRRRAARPGRHAARGRPRDDGGLARLGLRAAGAPPGGRRAPARRRAGVPRRHGQGGAADAARALGHAAQGGRAVRRRAAGRCRPAST